MRTYYLLVVALLFGCDQQGSGAALEPVGKSYNESHRDNIIKNYQNMVSDEARCAEFKNRLKTSGERHESAASGAFANDMIKILNESKEANCYHQ